MVSLALVAGFLLVAVAQASVLRFGDPYPKEVPAWVRFQHAVAPKDPFLSQMGYTISEFSWEDCGGSDDVIHINSLSLTHDLRITGSLTTSAEVNAPINIELDLYKKILFWIKVPCLGLIGTCTYENVCDKMAALFPTCPDQVSALGLPCHCPVSAGNYAVNDLDIDLGILEAAGYTLGSLPSIITNGKFRAEIRVMQDHQRLGCAKAAFTLHQ